MIKEFENTNCKSIYIHIPFCKRKCNYCAFVSFTNIDEFEEKYTNALIQELNSYNNRTEIKTIYLGGGTPNLLSINNWEKIFSCINKNFFLASNPEITMEFNPALSNKNYLTQIKSLGVNRISIGVQSFQKNILSTLNRLHDKQEALQLINWVQDIGFKSHSVDLMYGIFGQSELSLKEDLKILNSLNVPHISTYGLKIEHGTPFEKFSQNNLPNEEACEQMYLLISNTLEKTGYTHYEISNFAKENHQSQHNLTYWHNEEYLGVGTGAHGFINGIRYQKPNTIAEYIKKPISYEILNQNTQEDFFEETVFLGLRLKEGIDLLEIKNKFHIDLYSDKKTIIDKFINNNLARLDDNRLSLTTKGFLLSNYIIGEILV